MVLGSCLQCLDYNLCLNEKCTKKQLIPRTSVFIYQAISRCEYQGVTQSFDEGKLRNTKWCTFLQLSRDIQSMGFMLWCSWHSSIVSFTPSCIIIFWWNPQGVPSKIKKRYLGQNRGKEWVCFKELTLVSVLLRKRRNLGNIVVSS